MKKLIKTTLLILFLTVVSLITNNNVFAQKPITIDGIWLNGEFSQKGVDAFTPLNDGEHYARVDKDSKGNPAIYVYDYKTTTVTDSVFSVSKNVSPDSVKNFSSLSFSFDALQGHLLIPTRVEKIYRRGSKANYYVFDIKKKILQSLSTNGKQISPAFSPDGKKIAFVRDNNLFIKDLETGTEKQITTDGKNNFIINGINDWVY